MYIKPTHIRANSAVFRKPTSTRELEQLLCLRYDVYMQSPLAGFCEINHDGLDIDAWDWFSSHWGLFIDDGLTQFPIGYMRIVGDPNADQHDSLKTLSEQFHSVRDANESFPSAQFPCLDYPDAAGARSFLDENNKRGNIAVEPGRFSLSRTARSISHGKFMVDCAMAIFLLSQRAVSLYLICCATAHRAMYEAYGATLIPKTTSAFHPKANDTFQYLWGNKQSLPSRFLPLLESYSQQFDDHGEIRLSREKRIRVNYAKASEGNSFAEQTAAVISH